MKDKAVVIVFLGIIYALFIMNIITPARDISYSERRKLAQFPEISSSSVWDASAMSKFDDYAVDQIVLREQFRKLKAVFNMHVMNITDNNGIFLMDDMVFKTEYPINERKVLHLCDVINYAYDTYLVGNANVYYTIVPDKNYFITGKKHLIMDYKEIESLIGGNINQDIRYVSLYDTLKLSDYYSTDAHWRQERLGGVVAALGRALGVDMGFDIGDYRQNSFDAFYGVYYGQSALNIKPDELIYLTNDVTDDVTIANIEKPGQDRPLYSVDELGQIDSYNVFVEGPSSLLKITNPSNTSGRELVIFRDSYASSLAPLLLGGYSTITLIDLRYAMVNLLHADDAFIDERVGDYLEFKNQDVLFMYSTTLFNNSDSIRLIR